MDDKEGLKKEAAKHHYTKVQVEIQEGDARSKFARVPTRRMNQLHLFRQLVQFVSLMVADFAPYFTSAYERS